MMGAGKTSVGRSLSARLGWDLLDSDQQVEAMTGRTVPDIWQDDGEDAFRRWESQVLADALASTASKVIAAAGGVVLDEGNRRLLRAHHPVVWLRAPLEVLVSRVKGGEGRPLLSDDPAEAMRRLAGERRALYEEVADLVVDVEDTGSADDVAGRILDRLGLAADGPGRR